MFYLIESDFFIDAGVSVSAACFLLVPLGPCINASLQNVSQSFCLSNATGIADCRTNMLMLVPGS